VKSVILKKNIGKGGVIKRGFQEAIGRCRWKTGKYYRGITVNETHIA
jgi:hypothetical protein